MFRLALILFGGDALVRRWKVFMAAGVLTAFLGAVLLVDLVDGVADVATWVLGAVLLVQGMAEVTVGATHTQARRRFEMLRGTAMVVCATS